MGKFFFPYPGQGAIAELISDGCSAFPDLILFPSQGSADSAFEGLPHSPPSLLSEVVGQVPCP